jgi:hypothetical protein
VFELLLIVGLAVIALWVGRIFYILQKGLNEVITGLTSIDNRLAHLEDQLGATQAREPEPEA